MRKRQPEDEKLRVCLVSREYPPETAWGGIASYTQAMAHGLIEAGVEVEVVSLSVSHPEYTTLDGAVPVHRSRMLRWPLALGYVGLATSAGMLSNALRVARLVRHLHHCRPFDVVEAPAYFAEGLMLGLRPQVPLVVRLHTSTRAISSLGDAKPSLDAQLACRLEDAAARGATKLVTHSRYLADAAARELGAGRQRIAVVPHGIRPASRRADDGAAVRQETLCKPADVGHTVLFVGRLSSRKGADTLLAAVPRIVREVPGARFVVVGRDSPTEPGGRTYREHFEAFLANERSRAAVEWRGHVADGELAELYESCDVFAGPSRYESFGLVHLEAMAHGKPVVACRATATPEVVEDGTTGLLVEPGSVEGLAEALIALLRDGPLRSRMGEAARERAKLFSVESMVQGTLAVYHEAIALHS